MVKLQRRPGKKRGIELLEFRGRSGNGGMIEFTEDSDGVVYVILYDIDGPDGPDFVQIQTPEDGVVR